MYNIINQISSCIKEKTPISFLKYGDGEYNAVNNVNGKNCDNDKYTDKLKNKLIESFTYLVNNNNNAYIGCWSGGIYNTFWENLANTTNIKWTDYHTIIMDGNNQPEKINLYKTIRYSNLKKIIICNPLLLKAKILFNIDYMVNISFNNWFDSDYDKILNQVKKIMNNNEQYIVITACGMGAKVLISDFIKSYPNNIYLDFGSAIDKLCTKKNTRGGGLSYDQLLIDLKDIIPPNWNDSKYDYIYKEANNKLGTHITNK
jgi:hypothetical protein